MVLGALTVVLALVYSPVLTSHYLFHDDFFVFGWDHHSAWENYPYDQFKSAVKYGRMFYAQIYVFLFSFVNSVKDAAFIYVLAFLFLVGCGYLVYQAASKSFPKFIAAQISVLIMTLPCFQVIAAWAAGAPQLVPAFFSALAATLAGNMDKRPKGFPVIGVKLLAVFFLFFALGVHQQAAMFFWVITTMELAAVYQRQGWKGFLDSACSFGGVFLGAIALYVPFMVYSYHLYALGPSPEYDTGNVNFHFFSRLQWFLGLPLYRSLNLWVYPPKPLMALVTSGLLFLAAGRMTWKVWTEHKNWKVILPVLLGGSVLLTSYAPVLVSHYQSVCYRNATAITPLLLIFIIWGLKKEGTFFKAIILGVTLLACVQAHTTIQRHLVLPRVNEFRYIVESFKSAPPGLSYVIHEIIPTPAPQDRRDDEYDLLTSIFPNDRAYILYAGIQESGLTAGLKNNPLAAKEPVNILIDLNKVILPDNPYHLYSIPDSVKLDFLPVKGGG